MALLVVATISIAKTKGIVSEGKVVLLSMIGLSGKAAYSGLIPFADYSFYIFNSRILI